MQWITRVSLAVPVGLCVWIGWPDASVSAKPRPDITSVIEGRNTDGSPVVILIGKRANAIRAMQVKALDPQGPRYDKPGTLVVKSSKLAVWRLPDGIEADWGPDTFDLVFNEGKNNTAEVNVRLGFGTAPANSVDGSALRVASVDQDALTPGLRADLDDATTLGGSPASAFSLRADLASAAGAVNDPGNPLDWSQLKSVPDGFADGVDDIVAAGSGLDLTASTLDVNWGVDTVDSGTAETVSRSDHVHDQRYARLTDLQNTQGTLNNPGNPVDWSQLKNVPDDIEDGDDTGFVSAGEGLLLGNDTMSAAWGAATNDSGVSTQIARYDHQHDATYRTQVELANTSGVLNSPGNPVDWSQLKSVPAGIADGTDNIAAAGSGLDLTGSTLAVSWGPTTVDAGTAETAARSDHTHNAAYTPSSTLSNGSGVLNSPVNPVDWSQLKSVPAGFADGIDADTSYSAGTGLALSGTTFSVEYGGDGSAATASRSDHSHGNLLKTDGTLTTGRINLSSSSATVSSVTTSTSVGIAAVFGEASATVGEVYGVHGKTASTGGRAVFAEATATTGSPYAVYGTSASTSGSAVFGSADSTTGTPRGVEGQTAAADGVGVFGFANVGSSTSFGVQGVSLSQGTGVRGEGNVVTGTGVWGSAATGVAGDSTRSTGYGVRADNTSTTGDAKGVYATTSSSVGIAVDGLGTNTVGSSVGVRGESRGSLGVGVSGAASGNLGTNVGVKGEAQGTTGRGVQGIATSTGGSFTYGVHGTAASTRGTGVFGEATATTSSFMATGVHGKAFDGSGVKGEATATTGSGHGVLGTSFASLGAGVRGWNLNTTGLSSHGVYGEAESTASAGVFGQGTSLTSGTGVIGEGHIGVRARSSSTNGCAVWGEVDATSGTSYAVRAENDSPSGYGVEGRANATTGTNYGVHGSSASTGGRGVWGSASATTGTTIGVMGSSSSTAGTGVLAIASADGGVALSVNHSSSGSTGDLAVFQSQGANKARIDRTGQGFFNGGTATSGADFAESVAVNAPKSSFEPGDVIVIDPDGKRRFALSRKASSPRVAGIYSTRPGVLARPGEVAGSQAWRDTEIPLAITGIVPCKVCDENGPIRAGDLLVSASTPGYAMKAPTHPEAGTLVGKALEALDGRRGKVEVLITMR